MIKTGVNQLNATERKLWNEYFHMYNLEEYSYTSQMKAFADFLEENNINL